MLISTILGLLVAVAPVEGTRPGGGGGFETVGLYTDFGSVSEALPFLKSCGYNALEFCDASTLMPPAVGPSHHRRMVEGLRLARGQGMRVYIILLSNVGPMIKGDEPLEALHFSARDTTQMQARLDAIAREVRQLREADGFCFFSGDPGGDPSKRSDLRDCLAMGRKVQAIVAREAPKAEFIFNTWAIAAWAKWPSPMTVEFWEKETELTAQVVAEPGLIGQQVGIELPLHNYYRPLALRCFADAGKKPQLFPSRAEVDDLRKRGARRLWAWPYFLLDECDDGDTGRSWGLAQSETRYIRKIIDHARELGLNGVMGNLSWKSLQSEVLNTYAFARMARDGALTPEQVIREFAGLIADDATAADLASVLAFLENHSTWQAALPRKARLADLPCGDLDSPAKAMARLQRVKPRAGAAIPMPVKPAAYVEKLAERLRVLASQPSP
jgi:hypothetical protein